ncbi:uncharacterized protein LOC131958123 [Physella acuta]|uniref:uncharacterized protein LOC131958123 n=1 Tax=Physella acuta TaxID=109671 RepID=UPI0027DEAAF0|nr:uncharacterized protein LOC131958123 [Physella acuta]
MTTANVSSLPRLSSDSDPALNVTLTVAASLALIGCVSSLATKAVFRYIIPTAWKCCLLCLDLAALSLALGLLLTSCHVGGASIQTCQAAGFFTLFGLIDLVSCLTLTGITFLLIQNPSKMSHLSTFRWKVFLAIVLPQKLVTLMLAVLPVSPIDYFDQTTPYPLACFPIRQEGGKGSTFGAILFFILWGILAIAVTLGVVVAVKFWAGPGTRVHASSPSLWQMQKMEQGRSYHKFTLVEIVLAVVLMFVVTVVVYSNREFAPAPQWVALLSLAGLVLVHVAMATVQLSSWSGLCCDRTEQKKEPHHRLKQLELIKTEGPGKLRLKASWAAGKGVWKQGLLKVYGPEHIKAWAQEIVVLGLLRKSHSASVLQCLWTSNSNPYFEAMTLISGNIVTSDSRLTCLELTSSGTLQDVLKNMSSPMPDEFQKTIMRDIAEGLSYLHDQNVLHRNLTSAAVYLKGSVQGLVMRAAVGDFEDAQIYGTLLTGTPNSSVSRKRFFYPDIRAYALVGIELLGRVCECRHLATHSQARAMAKSFTAITIQQNPMAAFQEQNQLVEGTVFTGRNSFVPKHSASKEFPEYTNQLELSKIGSPKTDHVSEKQGTPKRKDRAKSNEKSQAVKNDIDANVVEYNIDQNWKLQMRASDVSLNSDWRRQDKTGREENRGYHVTGKPGITFVREARSIAASSSSAFRPAIDSKEELDLIEEEIEANNKRNTLTRAGNYKHGGYVTSKTQDGREIFIPAAYKLKKSSGASSSGYGSGGGSTPVQSEHRVSPRSEPGHPHKTPSMGVVDNGIVEVLPGMAFDVLEKAKRSEQLLNELLKAKQDARVEMLLESYDERVRRGELGVNDLPAGVIFPKKNKPPETGYVSIPGPVTNIPQTNVYLPNQVINNGNPNDVQAFSPSPTNSTSSIGHRMQRAPVSLGNAWNARSSIKRTRARTALKKALKGQSSSAFQTLPNRLAISNLTGKDVELKYSKRQGVGVKSEETGQKFTNNQGLVFENENISGKIPQQVLQYTETSGLGSVQKTVNLQDGRSTLQSSKKQSVKTRPAPPPPSVPPFESTFAKTLGKFSSFSSCDTDPHSSPRAGDESSTTVDPASTETESSARTSSYSRSQTNVEKIESDMNEIIHSNISAEKEDLPPGVKLVDSGFDTASVSSEESCLCAAAALQVAEDGSSSVPSEAFSQGTCSCACSNCLGSAQRFNNGSSWTGSQDSESWSNSNSFSSYDANMHRRKLPRKREHQDTGGCVLAPDEQYPCHTHRAKTGNSTAFPGRILYSPKRNHRKISHTRGHYPSSSSETSSAASRKYRELLKKGVPLRVSVIHGDTDTPKDNGTITSLKNNSIIDVASKDGALTTNHSIRQQANTGSESQKLLPPGSWVNNSGSPSSGHPSEDDDDDDERYNQLTPIPSLEDIMKEIPDETGRYPDETRAFLNRPDSELSLKALQAVLSRHGSSTEVKPTQPNELMIDRIFNHQGPPDNMASNFGLRGSQNLDESAIREVAALPGHEPDDTVPADIAGLLSGMDGRHIRYCHSISSRVGLVRMSDLLPANGQTFEKLATRLENTGIISSTGNQILELMKSCWLSDVPPTPSLILDQLKVNIIETEL